MMQEVRNDQKYLIVIAGPTAVGKTALSISLAQHFKTEILSADSRQIYKEMSVGTAKPCIEEMKNVPHHFVNSHSILEEFSAGKFEEEALLLMEKLFLRNQILFLVGGSGMYVKAVTEGFDALPEADPEFRQQLHELKIEKGIEALQEMLKRKDPQYYEKVDHQNPQRLMRALELIEASGKPISEIRKKLPNQRSFKTVKIGIDLEREMLYQRIDNRMDTMLEQGLLEEVRSLLPYSNNNALQTVGYREIFGFLDGKYNWDETVRLLKRNSRRYAKRQLTWFRHDPEFKWYRPDQVKDIIEYIEDQLFQKKSSSTDL